MPANAMTTRVLDKRETRLKTLELIELELARTYPKMHPVQRKILARKTVKQVLKKCDGQRIVLTTKPASAWQQFKLSYLPEWFLVKSPVRYIEI